MNEFDRIEKFFAPLAASSDISFGLKDDVALINAKHMVVTTDTIISGVHYIGNEPADLIAKKLLRCNLSDLAAKGAVPKYYTLNITLSAQQNESWLKAFALGLAEDQEIYGIKLIGGDSTSIKAGTKGSENITVLSLTAFGEVQSASAIPLRSGAKIGDAICISGTIGDAAIGLKIAKGELAVDDQQASNYLTKRYQLPQPRVKLGRALAPYMHASMDVSDGLMQDAGHMARSSDVGIEIYAGSVPLSEHALSLLNTGSINLQSIVSSGDDYEILCSISEENLSKAQAKAKELGASLTKIGAAVSGNETRLLDEDNKAIALSTLGYKHS